MHVVNWFFSVHLQQVSMSMMFIDVLQYTDSKCLYVCCLLNFYSAVTVTVYMYVVCWFCFITLTVTVYVYIVYWIFTVHWQ